MPAQTPESPAPQATPNSPRIRARLRRSARTALTLTVTAAVGLAIYREHLADPLAVAIGGAGLIGALRRR
ncbi:hypothetical protein [Streptomyces sp. NPDC059874]|uniref:hypothetical protein n=1 Tax=Streptomyces sp. NPDC059874 TaxID=3346983 RepID=UPI00365AF9AD